MYIKCVLNAAVVQLKLNRQRVSDGRSRDTESMSCQVNVCTTDDHLRSVGWP